MAKRVQNPISTYPATTRRTDRQTHSVWRVSPRFSTPGGARAADQATSVAGFAFGAVLVYRLAVPLDQNAIDWCCAGGVWIVTRAACRAALQGLLKVSVETEITRDHFRVRRNLVWTSYDLNRPHSFALVPHLRAQQEMRENELAQREAAMRGKALQKPVYFGDAYHVVFVYDGHVVYLFDVLGRAWGEAIVNRYQFICRERANEIKHKGGDNPHAGDDWYGTPGGLDDV